MKRFLILAVFALLMLFACGCDVNTADENSVPDSQITSSLPTEADVLKTAEELFKNLDKIDRLGASAIEMDTDDTFTVNEIYSYARVTDEEFPDLDSIKTFVRNNLTEKAKNSKYSAIWEGERPQYIEKDGVLYVLNGGRGCGYPIKGEIIVTDITENSFTARSDYDDFGADSVIQIKAVLEDGIWKIDEFKAENR